MDSASSCPQLFREARNAVFETIMPISFLADLFYTLYPTRSLDGRDTRELDLETDFLLGFIEFIVDNPDQEDAITFINEESGEPNSGAAFEYHGKFVLPFLVRKLPAHRYNLEKLAMLLETASETAYAWGESDESAKKSLSAKRWSKKMEQLAKKTRFENWPQFCSDAMQVIRSALVHNLTYQSAL